MSDTDIEKLKELFRKAPFVADLGIELESLGAGECSTSLEVKPRHLQQNGFVHAGVLATMADHTAGAAAFTRIDPGSYVVTAEFKLSLVRAARGDRLRCDATVIKGGRQLSFTESEVYCESKGGEQLVAKASATIAVVRSGEE